MPGLGRHAAGRGRTPGRRRLVRPGHHPDGRAVVDFTRPYAIFDETVLVRAGEPASAPNATWPASGSAPSRAAPTCALAETFPGVDPVPFGGATDDVSATCSQALRNGEVDAVVDDDVVLVPLGEQPDFASPSPSPPATGGGSGWPRATTRSAPSSTPRSTGHRRRLARGAVGTVDAHAALPARRR